MPYRGFVSERRTGLCTTSVVPDTPGGAIHWGVHEFQTPEPSRPQTNTAPASCICFSTEGRGEPAFRTPSSDSLGHGLGVFHSGWVLLHSAGVPVIFMPRARLWFRE